MTDEQRRGIAAGFLHVLATTPSVFEAWLATPKDDAAAVCALVATSLGLAEVPSAEDLHAMARHIDAALREKAQELVEVDGRIPRHVGFIAYMQNAAGAAIDDVQLRELLELSRLTAAR